MELVLQYGEGIDMQKTFRYITLGFIVSFLIIAGLCIYSTRQYGSLINYSNQVDHTNRVINHLYLIRDILQDFDMHEREYMIMKDYALINNYQTQVQKINHEIKGIEKLTDDNEHQKANVILLKSAFAMRIDNFKKNIENVRFSDSNKISAYYLDGRAKKVECYNYLDKMLREEQRLLDERTLGKREREFITSATTRFLMVLFLIITIFLFVVMMQELRQKVRYQDELQVNLHDLKNSHSELKQIAFAASHDLKEPLRKIKIFSDRLLWLHKGNDNPDIKTTVDKISFATNDVQELTNEIIKLVNVIKDRNFDDRVDLNKVLRDVESENMDNMIIKNGVIYTASLPTIIGDATQISILFNQLIDNALKFSKDGLDTVIKVNSAIVTGEEIPDTDSAMHSKKFYRITFSDNGIGFDNAFTHKIFKAFQRLHNNQTKYKGRGIGLAICQRVMVNHRGFIVALGHPDLGATFHLYFPAES